ncbi:hypothetical protein [Gelidibacter salicanalis]|nr:hypothetical protein [Gelidibacter salicanalis]
MQIPIMADGQYDFSLALTEMPETNNRICKYFEGRGCGGQHVVGLINMF